MLHDVLRAPVSMERLHDGRILVADIEGVSVIEGPPWRRLLALGPAAFGCKNKDLRTDTRSVLVAPFKAILAPFRAHGAPCNLSALPARRAEIPVRQARMLSAGVYIRRSRLRVVRFANIKPE
jgi:hypothetical protein